jgi:hypothetical protein
MSRLFETQGTNGQWVKLRRWQVSTMGSGSSQIDSVIATRLVVVPANKPGVREVAAADGRKMYVMRLEFLFCFPDVANAAPSISARI